MPPVVSRRKTVRAEVVEPTQAIPWQAPGALLAEGERLYTEQEAAKVLGLKNPGTLSVWRCTRRYALPFVRVGRSIRYRHSDLAEFIQSRTVGAVRA